MDERTIFNRFHEALDVEPPGGAYDRLRLAFTSPPVVLNRRSGFQMRFTRMGFRLAAALVTVVIVVVAVIAYVSLHHSTTRIVPANHGQDIRPYQALIARDYAKTFASEGGHCESIADTACKAEMGRFIANVQTWIQDLNAFTPPSRLGKVDAMLRIHLAQAVKTGNMVIAAQQAGNAATFAAASTAHFPVRAFIVDIAPAIANTHVMSSATYLSTVRDQMDLLSSCTPCARYLATPSVTCTKPVLLQCIDDVVAVDAQVYDFESTVVQDAAPSSLAAKDANLQRDLVAADEALMSMIDASLAGSSTGFTSAAASAQASMTAAAADVKSLPNR